MKLRNVNLKLNKEQFQHLLSRARQAWRSAPRWLFVKHSHLLNLSAVILVLLLGGLLFMRLTYIPVPGVEREPEAETVLKTDVIDELEYWIEARRGEAERQIRVPNTVNFGEAPEEGDQ